MTVEKGRRVMLSMHWGSNYAFSTGSAKHAAVLIALVVAAVAIVAVGRRLSAVTRHACERVAGLMLVGVWLAGFTFDLANPRASALTTLPLHWCDVCGALAVFVMFEPQNRLPRVILHFWALCLCSFAFALPVIGLGPNFIDFWIYFGTHGAILLAAVYDVGVRGFMPGRRDLAWAWGTAAAWVLFLQPINLALGANYGFVGADDQNVRKAITGLGAWPWRLAPMMAIELAMMATLMVVEQGVVTAMAWASKRRPPLLTSYPLPASAEAAPLAQAA